MKALEIKTSLVFNLGFANNIFYNVFLFFLIVNLYFLIPVVIAPISYPTVRLVIPVGTPTKQAKSEIGKHPVTTEVKTGKCSIKYNAA